MFLLNNSDIAILTSVCVVNLFCAGVVRRSVLFNSGFIQRRILFEGLSLFGFLGAIGLSLFSILIWVSSPSFVIACTLIWVILCVIVVVRIWRGHRYRLSSKVLEIPAFWNEESISYEQSVIMTGKKAEDSMAVMSSPPKPSDYTSTLPVHKAPAPKETETVGQASQANLPGNHIREKIDKYNKKRAYKSAVISNLSAYRQRSNTVVPESTIKTACQ